MNGTPGLAAAILLGGLAFGCQDNDIHDGYRQEGDLETRSLVELHSSPYSPILGDTTGDGLPRDRRTGGGIDGIDVSVYQRLKAGRGLPPADIPNLSPAAPIPPPPAVQDNP